MDYNLLFILLLSVYFSNCKKEDQAVNVPEGQLSYLALGDSYTIGESVATAGRPIQLARELRQVDIPVANTRIIAKTGWRTDDLRNAIVQENPDAEYDLVSLLIGVNNQIRTGL